MTKDDIIKQYGLTDQEYNVVTTHRYFFEEDDHLDILTAKFITNLNIRHNQHIHKYWDYNKSKGIDPHTLLRQLP